MGKRQMKPIGKGGGVNGEGRVEPVGKGRVEPMGSEP